MLQAMLDGQYKPKGIMQWRTYDMLVRKGLVLTRWNRDSAHDDHYIIPADVRLALINAMGIRTEE